MSHIVTRVYFATEGEWSSIHSCGVYTDDSPWKCGTQAGTVKSLFFAVFAELEIVLDSFNHVFNASNCCKVKKKER